MKIIVEVEVPDGDSCNLCNQAVVLYDYINRPEMECHLFDCKHDALDHHWLKCPACLAACQKAMECEPKPLPTKDFIVSSGSGGTVVLDGTGRINHDNKN